MQSRCCAGGQDQVLASANKKLISILFKKLCNLCSTTFQIDPWTTRNARKYFEKADAEVKGPAKRTRNDGSEPPKKAAKTKAVKPKK